MNNLSRITLDPFMMGGKPCIRGMRVTVRTIVSLVASEYSFEDILKLYPYLEKADIAEALKYVGRSENDITYSWNIPKV